ncbi:PAS domain S-box-containing protein [Verrucomicrobium sp. GAS474]|uniref:hybrid sensor histidine kinase/response regulator n=1 Tax=Verrucomicrobium sp. GAS474 TaxID=1882831 RepID=UPI00087BC515|nr:PAS domain-containing sensor histidine kinase [Verrucomicrobium sp. GAS474]SDU11014.1 PAS domain S-box-containing protein [Verrucomicrobium sp. GAS474]
MSWKNWMAAEINPGRVDAKSEKILSGERTRLDSLLTRFLVLQWAVLIGIALFWTSGSAPSSFTVFSSRLWDALILGAGVILVPAWMGFTWPGRKVTHYALAVAQMGVAALLIHLCGGRAEAHFYIFISLAVLAFYWDARLLLTAAAVVFIEHFGIEYAGGGWRENVAGFIGEEVLSHGLWIAVETAFLLWGVQRMGKFFDDLALRQIFFEEMGEKMGVIASDRARDLREAKRQLKNLVERAPIGLYRADAEGKLEMANPMLVRMLGYESFREMAEAGVRLSAPLLAEAAAAPRGAVRSRNGVWEKKEGAVLHVRENLQVVRNDAGEVVCYDGSLEDVTDRKALEERYLQAQKVQALGQLAGGVAHDFNNILTVIAGCTEMLEEDVPGPVVFGYTKEIRQATDQATDMTRQLLAFSRKQEFQVKVFSVNSVIEGMDKMIRRLVGERIDFEFHGEADLWRVKADSGQIQQVLMNLAVNARDAMPDGGKLRLETANVAFDEAAAQLYPEITPGDYVVVSVSDTGCGMSPEVRSRIFEPFFTTKEVGKGTGLGLATCYGIVQQSGGHITVYSEPDHGTTFRVYLPRNGEAETAMVAPVRTGMPKGRGETILLAEDEPMVRTFVEKALTSLGYKVYVEPNGQAAMERFFTLKRVDLLFVDVFMPEMGGIELVTQLRRIEPDIRVLFTSGHANETFPGHALDGRRTDFIAKPYTVISLVEKIQAMLRGGGDLEPALQKGFMAMSGLKK